MEWQTRPNTYFNNSQLDLPNGGNTSHAFADYGTYQIEQVVHNYTTGCSDSITLAVAISQVAIPRFFYPMTPISERRRY